MRWTRRRVETVTTRVIVAAWVVFYAVALATSDQLPGPVTAVVQLVVPPLLGCSPPGSSCATGGPRPGPACPR
jgi:hypothetical protein